MTDQPQEGTAQGQAADGTAGQQGGGQPVEQPAQPQQPVQGGSQQGQQADPQPQQGGGQATDGTEGQ